MLYLRLLSECGCLLFESINHYPSINVHFNIQRGQDSRVTTLLEEGGPRFLFFTTSSFTSYSWPGPRPDCSKVVSGWPRAFRISPFSSFCQTERCPHTLTMWSQNHQAVNRHYRDQKARPWDWRESEGECVDSYSAFRIHPGSLGGVWVSTEQPLPPTSSVDSQTLFLSDRVTWLSAC